MAVIELVDKNEQARKIDKPKKEEKKADNKDIPQKAATK